MLKKNTKLKSSYFNFRNIKKSKSYKISYYKGWHNLLIFRVEFLKTIKEKNFFSKNEINNSSSIEKILILSSGNAIVKEKNFKKKLKKFDCIHTYKSLKNFELECKKGSQLFVIFGGKKMKTINKNNFFNFEKDLKKIDLWGGKCISRVFSGYGMTVVLFKLKRGFKFHDKGHKNEQITWLIKGKMKFYVKNKSLSLEANKTSVDIGSYDFHGGISLGAIGFDVFSPKRSESRYS